MIFRALMVGLGKMGRNHLRVLREDPRFEVVALVDPSPQAAVEAKALGLKVLPSLDEAGGLEWDCAVVATPTVTHYEMAYKLLDIGRPFLIEKPLCQTPEQCREILERAGKAGVAVGVGHLERFNPAVRKLKELLDANWIGRPIHFSFTRVGGYPETLPKGNNVLLDLAVHDLDVLRHMVGDLRLLSCVSHSTWSAGVQDTAEIVVKAESGPSASLHVNWVTPTKIRTVRVTGTQGVCFVDYILQSCVLMGGNLLRRAPTTVFDFHSLMEEYKSTDRVEFGITKVEPLKAQLTEFYKLLSGQPSEICSLEDAAAAVTLADSALNLSVSSERK